VSKEVADKWLAQLEAEVARKAGAVPRALRENPKDASWVDKLDFSEPNIVKALFNGNADRLVQLLRQVLTYIAAFNDQFSTVCLGRVAGSKRRQMDTDGGARWPNPLQGRAGEMRQRHPEEDRSQHGVVRGTSLKTKGERRVSASSCSDGRQGLTMGMF
jgi:hypothetical protein